MALKNCIHYLGSWKIFLSPSFRWKICGKNFSQFGRGRVYNFAHLTWNYSYISKWSTKRSFKTISVFILPSSSMTRSFSESFLQNIISDWPLNYVSSQAVWIIGRLLVWFYPKGSWESMLFLLKDFERQKLFLLKNLERPKSFLLKDLETHIVNLFKGF